MKRTLLTLCIILFLIFQFIEAQRRPNRNGDNTDQPGRRVGQNREEPPGKRVGQNRDEEKPPVEEPPPPPVDQGPTTYQGEKVETVKTEAVGTAEGAPFDDEDNTQYSSASVTLAAIEIHLIEGDTTVLEGIRTVLNTPDGTIPREWRGTATESPLRFDIPSGAKLNSIKLWGPGPFSGIAFGLDNGGGQTYGVASSSEEHTIPITGELIGFYGYEGSIHQLGAVVNEAQPVVSTATESQAAGSPVSGGTAFDDPNRPDILETSWNEFALYRTADLGVIGVQVTIYAKEADGIHTYANPLNGKRDPPPLPAPEPTCGPVLDENGEPVLDENGQPTEECTQEPAPHRQSQGDSFMFSQQVTRIRVWSTTTIRGVEITSIDVNGDNGTPGEAVVNSGGEQVGTVTDIPINGLVTGVYGSFTDAGVSQLGFNYNEISPGSA